MVVFTVYTSAHFLYIITKLLLYTNYVKDVAVQEYNIGEREGERERERASSSHEKLSSFAFAIATMF